jgi:hypothetical protein
MHTLTTLPRPSRHAGLFPPSKGKLAAAAKLRSSKTLEYTLVSNGFFLDYYGIPKVKSYLNPKLDFAVDVANNVAAIPGNGDMPVVFTHTFDVAKFVAALVGAPDWPERSTVIGDKKSWKEFVAIAEEVKGSYPCPSTRPSTVHIPVSLSMVQMNANRNTCSRIQVSNSPSPTTPRTC